MRRDSGKGRINNPIFIKGDPMSQKVPISTEQMKVLIQRFYDMLNKPNMNIADEIFAPSFVAHFPLAPILTRSNFKNFIQSFYGAFPDFIMEINDRVMTNSQLVLRVTFYGTHEGDFLGIAATGCQITMPGISIFQVENNLIVENWTEIDVFGVVRQISRDSLLEGSFMNSV
jgi:steroid delta-isomerase-like uncharacterized protein